MFQGLSSRTGAADVGCRGRSKSRVRLTIIITYSKANIYNLVWLAWPGGSQNGTGLC